MLNAQLGKSVDFKTFERALFKAAEQVGLKPQVDKKESYSDGHIGKEIQCSSRLGYGIRVYITDAFGEQHSIAYTFTGKLWPILAERKARKYVEAVRRNLETQPV